MTATAPLKALTPPVGATHARILGIGAYRPERVVDNNEICLRLDSTDEWIRERTGIISRRFAAADETVVDMAEHASRDAMAAAGIEPTQLGSILLATVTHPYQTPAAAPMLAHRLGATNTSALDLSAACAGYCHAIALAGDMVRGGSAEYVLVVGVEKLSDFTDPTDRGSAFIFGDGAGAVVIGPSDFPGIGPTVWGAEGDKFDAIIQRDPWTDFKSALDGDEVAEKPWPAFIMKGQTVFRWAVYSMAPVAMAAIEKAGITIDDLDVFIPHQANMRIIDAMIKQLGLPSHIPVARDIAESGNTSAASVPLATERMLREGSAKSGDLALQIGFGAGLVYAAQVVVLP